MKLIDYGPKLHIQLHITEDKISKTVVEARNQEGTSWELVTCDCSRALEKNIDQWFLEYCSGRQPIVNLSLDFTNYSSFTQAVFISLSSLSFGQTLSYQKLAALAGNPNAPRAAGGACGRNPVPFILPCHRILTSGNRLGGFSLGLEIKKALLAHEGILLK